jgi:putative transposase
VLDAVLGQVLFADGSKVGVATLGRFFAQVRRAYGAAMRLVLVWDNGPVHAHPEVLPAAREQRIELLFLPTYAPWTNPIEKLWRQLQEEVLLMHRYSDRWPELKERVRQFLRDYEQPSPDLLRYVGLALPD